MNRPSWRIMAAGLVLAVLISNIGSFVDDGRRLDRLRGGVLRLHILANSDSARDQRLKLTVRDELLRRGLFSDADCLEEAEAIAEDKLTDIENIAETVLRRQGSADRVSAELVTMRFGERVYGDMTMPAGTYRALRIKIGRAEGHNWWCVMYPPLCLPAACGDAAAGKLDTVTDTAAEEECFDEKELDILRKPKKYRVRFAIWDKIRELLDDDVVQNDKNKDNP